MPTDFTCPYCGGQMLRATHPVHGGYFACERYPDCDSKVGMHHHGPRKGTPLGIPADKALRSARIRVHAAIDPLWRDIDSLYPEEIKGQPRHKLQGIARSRLYRLLSERMGMARYHTAELDLEQCERVIAIAETLTPAKIRKWAKAERNGKRKSTRTKSGGSGHRRDAHATQRRGGRREPPPFEPGEYHERNTP